MDKRDDMKKVGNENSKKLNKKPVVKVLMEQKDVVYASEALAHCSNQC